MNLIVVPDIFGISSELRELTSKLSECYSRISIVDPYDDRKNNFLNEKNAYQYFQQYCGLKILVDKLEKEIIEINGSVDILGFSVGGTCAWEISGKSTLKNIRQIACFYGSRIREKTDISPQFPTILIFPSHEENSDIEPVIQVIEQKPNTEVIRTEFLHGFMNRKSINFSEPGYQYYNKWLIEKGSTTG